MTHPSQKNSALSTCVMGEKKKKNIKTFLLLIMVIESAIWSEIKIERASLI